jgi:hypothetical protein
LGPEIRVDDLDGADLGRNIILAQRPVEEEKADSAPFVRFLLRVRVEE